MSEAQLERIDRCEFSDLNLGDTINLTLGVGDEAYKYTCVMLEVGKQWPLGTFTEIAPDGAVTGPMAVEMHGCGQWTTRQQNPVQDQLGEALTPYWDGLLVGRLMIIKDPKAAPGDRLVFDKPGQKITEISVARA